MKLVHRAASCMVVLFLIAVGASTARGVIVMDSFGDPQQSIRISGTSASVSSPFFLPPFPFPPGGNVSNGPLSIMSGTYQVPNTYPVPPDVVFNNTGYLGNNSTFYSFAELNTASAGIISTAPGGGMTDFSQRDVRLTVTGNVGSNAEYDSGSFVMNGEGGLAATLLLQYDGVDTVADVASPLAAFTNSQGLSDGGGPAGYDIIGSTFNDRFFFDNVTGDGDIAVTIRVWADGVVGPQVATGVISLVLGGPPTDHSILFSAFNGGMGAVNFDRVLGIDIEFVLDRDEDLRIGPGEGLVITTPEPATFAMWSLLGMSGMGLSFVRRRVLAA